MPSTSERNTAMREGDIFAYDLAPGVRIHKGTLVVLDAGYARPGLAKAAALTVGVACESADARAGETRVNVRTGTFLFRAATGKDEITRTEIGKPCFLVDDETVAKTNDSGARPVAGRVRAIEGANVWITI